jgi:hypothetical protein
MAQGSQASDMVVSGLIAAAIAAVFLVLISFVVPFPWSLGQTVVAAAIASFSGAAVSYSLGHRKGSGGGGGHS